MWTWTLLLVEELTANYLVCRCVDVGGKRLEASGQDKQLDGGVWEWAPPACVLLLGPCRPRGHCAAASGAIVSQQTAAGSALASGPCPCGWGRTQSPSFSPKQQDLLWLRTQTSTWLVRPTGPSAGCPPAPMLVFGDCVCVCVGGAQALCVGCPAHAK